MQIYKNTKKEYIHFPTIERKKHGYRKKKKWQMTNLSVLRFFSKYLFSL